MKMGAKIFCYKHDKILKSPVSFCNDFSRKLGDEVKEKAHLNISRAADEGVEPHLVEGEEDYGDSSKIFLAAVGGGFIVISLILWASGVF
jgi:hypothetical protein